METMLKLIVLVAVFSRVYSTGIKLHFTDEMKAMLRKSKWNHKNTTISIHGPMTLDIHSSYKLKEGQVFLRSKGQAFLNSDIKQKDKDCAGILKHRPQSKDGVYMIYPDMKRKKFVYCDMTTDGGGWTVIQRRQDGSVSFNRTWIEYKNGFGDINGEYWLGNEAIHLLTTDRKQNLRIDLERFSGSKANVTYSTFYIGNESDEYKLTIGGFNGARNVGNSFREKSGYKFSTIDRDNDASSGSCAKFTQAGDWFVSCGNAANLNGIYRKNSRQDATELAWYTWGRTWKSLKAAKMMLRPKQ